MWGCTQRALVHPVRDVQHANEGRHISCKPSAVALSHVERRWLVAPISATAFACLLGLVCAPPALLAPVARNKNSLVKETVIPVACRLTFRRSHGECSVCLTFAHPVYLRAIALRLHTSSCGHTTCPFPCPTMSSTLPHDLPLRQVPCMLGSIDQKTGLSWTEPTLTLDDIRDPVAAKTRFLVAYGTLP